MKVQEVMSIPPVTCRVDDGLDTPARLMWENDCGVIPVVDNDGSVVGMITDRDICMAAYTQGSPLCALRVSNTMSKQVYSCGPDDSLASAEQLMSQKQIRRLPVMDGQNRPMGVISMNDIARAAASHRNSATDHQVVKTIAAICKPRPLVRTNEMTAAQSP